jgi:hypothetical protein
MLPAMLAADLTVTSPTSSDVWPLFSTQTIEWEVDEGDGGIQYFYIYWTENVNGPPIWIYIDQVDGDVREYDWQVGYPITYPPKVSNPDAQIKVLGAFIGRLSIYGVSDKFTIN